PKPLCRRWAISPSVRTRRTTVLAFGKSTETQNKCPDDACPFVASLSKQNTQRTTRKKTMSTQNQNGYMLIFRGTDWYKGLSPEQMQQVADQWMAWFNGLKNDGTAV